MTELIHIRKTCRLCDSPRLVRSVPLAAVPIVSPNVGTETDASGARITKVVAPLDNYLCQDCGLIQLVHVVDPALIYRDYRYRTSVSLGLPEHFRGLAESVVQRQRLGSGDHVVEFGSNDGTLLKAFKDMGTTVTGVDPAREIAAEATRRGVPTRADFFTQSVARDIRGSVGPAKAIIANNAMANIDDLGEIFRAVAALLAPDGAFVFETQYALDVFERTLLDVIYHEHISCFSVTPVVKAVRRFGLEVFDAERIPTKGGSIRFWVRLADGPQPVAARVGDLMTLEDKTGLHTLPYHGRFAARVAEIKTELHKLIATAQRQNKRIAAFGTSVGSAALIHQFELEDKLDMLFDDSPFKERLEGPGYDLPVYRGDKLEAMAPALTIVLAWRYAQPITAKHAEYIAAGGRFVVPLPAISLIPEPAIGGARTAR